MHTLCALIWWPCLRTGASSELSSCISGMTDESAKQKCTFPYGLWSVRFFHSEETVSLLFSRLWPCHCPWLKSIGQPVPASLASVKGLWAIPGWSRMSLWWWHRWQIAPEGTTPLSAVLLTSSVLGLSSEERRSLAKDTNHFWWH